MKKFFIAILIYLQYISVAFPNNLNQIDISYVFSSSEHHVVNGNFLCKKKSVCIENIGNHILSVYAKEKSVVIRFRNSERSCCLLKGGEERVEIGLQEKFFASRIYDSSNAGLSVSLGPFIGEIVVSFE